MFRQEKLQFLIYQSVGVSLINGQCVSGILCAVSNGEMYLLEYLYHTPKVMPLRYK